MEHILKCWPEPFAALKSGAKKHEVRKDDRGYAVGDLIRLREYKPTGVKFEGGEVGSFTGNSMSLRVTYKSAGGTWGLPADVCVLSVEPCEEPRP